MRTSAMVRAVCRGKERDRKWRRKRGKRPKSWIEKRVRLKTEVVVGRREARTVEAMTAALVDRDEGYVFCGGRVFVAGVGDVTGASGAIEVVVSTCAKGAREGAVADVAKEACEALAWSVPLAWTVAGGVADVLALRDEMLEGTYWLP